MEEVKSQSLIPPSPPPPPPEPLPSDEQKNFKSLCDIMKRYHAESSSGGGANKLENIPKIIKRLVQDLNDAVSAPDSKLEKEAYEFIKDEIGSFICVATLRAFRTWTDAEHLSHYASDLTHSAEPILLGTLKYLDESNYGSGTPVMLTNYAGLLFCEREHLFDRTVSESTHLWLIEQARAIIEDFKVTVELARKGEQPGRDNILLNEAQFQHLQMIADGGLPWSYERDDVSFRRHIVVDPFAKVFNVEELHRNGGECVIDVPEKTWYVLLATAARELEIEKRLLTETTTTTTITDAQRDRSMALIKHLEQLVATMQLPKPFRLQAPTTAVKEEKKNL